ncbi:MULTISPECIES: primosomal protein N' [unclassified Ruminococcus]|uniref:primosomal protein N' n=1 Tax=unclassified Ruminococcus TaxID=2608920 RepID=UPI00210BEB50|nr:MULTISPECIES: primosomal protein N' [unclassified Ruminococcus]MCQ4022594.1 primosomal protein N' [Ruminococcus sp. zg-924]MCQ4114834.1 primosomal protein N' [Ruminococcus sp. zg-921]
MTDINKKICRVAVENAAFGFDKLFDYEIGEDIAAQNVIGCRVLVPFGKSRKQRQGIVFDVFSGDGDSTKSLKKISVVLDREPLLSDEMLRLAAFIKSQYFCTYYEAARAMLPAGFNYKIKETYCLNADYKGKLILDDTEQAIVSFVGSANHSVSRQEICSAFELDFNTKLLDDLCKSGVLESSESAVRCVGDLSEKMVELCTFDDEADALTPKQKEVFELLKMAGEISLKEIIYFTGYTKAVVDALVKKGYARYFDREVIKSAEPSVNAETVQEISLTQEQNRAYLGLCEKYKTQKPCVSLLYGVTGSGKTSVFMKLIDRISKDGRGIIVMVPEIALTPQIINIFKARYGGSVAVFHSALSLGERINEWKRVRCGEAKIAIGTRSAVFAPVQNLGLIIMDEEQEYTYKSESTPRYHAREVAKFRCKENSCMLLLSSATPSIESYYKAQTGVYSLFTLSKRYGKAQLPPVLVADMNIELEQGNKTVVSSVLLQSLQENLAEGKQSILLLNRRGYNTFVACRHCKEVVSCPNCSISLTYHSANNRLMCHYCGYSIALTDKCPSCHEHGLRFSGTGTQKAEETLAALLPGARILRLDADATMRKNSHETLLGSFKRGEYDILIGTQMVAKGLDFPNVTLVGVLSADQILYSDDYRSFERSFSLLTQVVGRAGRGDCPGRAVIQTFTPDSYVINLSAMQDYLAFYNTELAMRRSLLYPPFSDICMIGFVGDNELLTANAAKECTRLLCRSARETYPQLPLRVLGPTAAAVKKVSNKYRYKTVLKYKNSRNFRTMLSQLLIDFGKISKYSRVTVYVDVNPESIL